ncbi:MAG TPA: hypothetical protein VEJ47_11420 [Candidatus Eremiobacteraceae bacterium]|nr:hypothetical protein [Candidatus Eremiobacteraceae bacterium]
MYPMVFYVVVMAFVATLAVVILRQRSLYVLFLATYLHHFVVPFLYTNHYVGKEPAYGLFLFKDILLLELFAWSAVLLLTRFRRPWPLPMTPLLVLTFYCAFRFLVGAVFLGDEWGSGLIKMKMICFPLEILIVVMTLTALHPEFGKRFLRNMTYVLAVLAVVAVAIFVLAPRDFWLEHANIAEYNREIKGDTENEQDFDTGVPGSATMGARAEAFADFASLRAVGTFGDALTLSFQMAVPVLLLSFYFPKTPASVLMLLMSGAAMLCSLSRSGWVFAAVVGTCVLVRRRHYKLLLSVGSALLAVVLLWPPMTQFAVDTVSNLSPSAENADTFHAEGLLYFYTRGFSDPGNILGKGTRSEVRQIPEIGYAYLLEFFGLVAYGSFLWFCFALYRQFGKGSQPDPLGVFVQGISVGMLVVMHFSQYPFAFTEFISVWYVVGFGLSRYLLLKTNPGEEPVQLRRRAPLGNVVIGPGLAH